MTREDLKTEFFNVLSTFSRAKDVLITEELDLVMDLKIKSAKLIDILLIFEERYTIEVDTDEMDDMLSVGAALDILEEYIIKK